MTLKEIFANMFFVVLDFIIIIIIMLCTCTSTLQFNRSRDRQYADNPNATYASMALHGKDPSATGRKILKDGFLLLFLMMICGCLVREENPD